ncbi:3-deoxy-7-phosphoheptulonate synthase [Acinetobacter sp. MYb177]|jgi:3-deoxy-7-phosphoheptulonate synthase|nr:MULTISPECIES: 3-deoxy-7-phosphoheptulonate synthase [Acinetobacter]MDN5443705.1 3-deoxy-7-phosphoheptulonate synthase [Acinetobacter sp.]NWK48335.1 3-deoxy-7-phosphoheptulonate synthase [Acinetobacter sp. SwsAc7]OFW97442.1 MAG: 3-deoxy-7-phosphoheptulonate synthase [Acinetobacter sp. RIFCSPHIGHO2_12_41_5]OHC20501.1 MAG: 3-deoxy-7-phosphoheptulonate synthase [Pseudomonadales bacterium RIFCSPHIGHO2_12_FULL_40_16]AXF45394.1 3-deoxy-7-phosphoheptulonate synthase [Acinetobacter johnsonii]
MNTLQSNSITQNDIDDVNLQSIHPLVTPAELKTELPLTESAYQTVLHGRETIRNILDGKDKRIFVVIGPCSIHDPVAAHEYADRLKVLSDKIKDSIYVVMRVYFEKPRTTVGWKGLINDPDMNDSFNIEKGLRIGRKLLVELNEKGLPCATEALDPNSPQYYQDLISWSAIGARTTESQTHREMSSGLSSPVGFKNGTDGGLTVATNAMQSVKHGHHFLGLNNQGQVSVIRTSGNPYAHVVLRGGNGKPNYDAGSVAEAEAALAKAKVSTKIMIDTSHANSNKDPFLQPLVLKNITEQIIDGNKSIIGIMVESHLKGGRQEIPENLCDLEYGKSVTDGCIDWDTTEKVLLEMHEALKDVLPNR